MTQMVATETTGVPPALLVEEILVSGQFFDASTLDPAAVGQAFTWAEFTADNAPGDARHQVYNFEVEGTHTYIAGGIRVHNRSVLNFLTAEEAGGLIDVSPDGSTATFLNERGVETVIKLGERDDGTQYVELREDFRSNSGATVVYRQVRTERDGSQEPEVIESELFDVETIYGQVGESFGGLLAPYLASAFIPTDNVFAQLVGTTVLDATLSNSLEAFGDYLNGNVETSADADGDGEITATEAAQSAFQDFSTDLALAGIDQISGFIAAQIFGAFDLDPTAEAALQSVAHSGINAVLTEGLGLLNQQLGLGLTIPDVDFSAIGINAIPALVSAVLISSLDLGPVESAAVQGALQGLVASNPLNAVSGMIGAIIGAAIEYDSVAAHQAYSAANSAVGVLVAAGVINPAVAIPLVFGAAIIGEIVDIFADVNPTAQAITSYNSVTRLFETDYIYEGDGGNIPLAEALGDRYTAILNEITGTLSAEITSDHHRSLGHWKSQLITEFDNWVTSIQGSASVGQGEDQTTLNYSDSYPFDQQTLVFYAVLSEVYELTYSHGDAMAIHVLNGSREHFDEKLNTYFIRHLIDQLIASEIQSGVGEDAVNNSGLSNQELLELAVNRPHKEDALRSMMTIQGVVFEDFFEVQTYNVGDENYYHWVMTESYADFADAMFRTDETLVSVFQDLTSNLQIAADYRTMLQNNEEISAIIDLNPDSAFAATWALTLAQALELGITDLDINAVEILYGNGIDNTINALGGDDVIYGGLGDDVLFGGHGRDYVFGGDGDDVVSADAGSGGWQYLYGEAGDDTYLYAKAGGDVYIGHSAERAGLGSADGVAFTNLDLSDVSFSTHDYTAGGTNGSVEGVALRVTWTDGTDSGELRIANGGEHIEEFQFADGTVLNQILLADAAGTPHANGVHTTTRGTDGRDYIIGGAGYDEIYSYGGDDVLDVGGSAGADWQYAYGGSGDDTYVYGKDAGKLYIGYNAEHAGLGLADTVVFSDLSLNDLSFSTHDYTAGGTNGSVEGVALRVTWTDGTDSGELRIANGGEHIEAFQFADGTVFNQILLADAAGTPHTNGVHTTTRGTDGRDYIIGGAGYDEIYSYGGDDVLDVGGSAGADWQYAYGGSGDDTYVYGKDAGKLYIGYNAEHAGLGLADTVVFSDLSLNDLSFSTHDYTAGGTNGSVEGVALRVTWTDGTDSGELRIANGGEHIEAFHFADGTVLNQILLADAAGTPHTNGVHTTTRGTDGRDYIIGGAGYDEIYSYGGDDVLDVGGSAGADWQYAYGGSGDDTYVYGKDAGKLYIGYNAEHAGLGLADTVVFSDLSLNDLSFSSYDYTAGGTNGSVEGVALRVTWTDGTDSGELRIANGGEHIEAFEFADGTVLTEITL